MYDYMKTIISALKHWVAEMIFKSTADWEQHDASQADYVKNRPFYDDRDVGGELKRIDHKYLPEDIGVQADWAEEDESSKAFILNKPTILQSDWLETDETSQAFILNKPDVSDTHLTLFDEEYNCVYRIEMRHGDLVSVLDVEKTLVDFEYTYNAMSGKYTLTSWKGTYRGKPSTRIIVPNSELFIV